MCAISFSKRDFWPKFSLKSALDWEDCVYAIFRQIHPFAFQFCDRKPFPKFQTTRILATLKWGPLAPKKELFLFEKSRILQKGKSDKNIHEKPFSRRCGSTKKSFFLLKNFDFSESFFFSFWKKRNSFAKTRFSTQNFKSSRKSQNLKIWYLCAF